MDNETLRQLHTAAGEYPELKTVTADGTFTCPLCSGEGEIDADCVKDGTSVQDTGFRTSIVGVQVYGVGEGMSAMEKLVPAMMAELPRLLRESDELRTLKAKYASTGF